MIRVTRPLSSAAFSEWLDCFRWISAWVVMVSHVGGVLLIPLSRLPQEYHSFPQYIYSFIAGFSHYAVMIFFVMSGYLVGGSYVGSSSKDRPSLSGYFAKRITRLLIVLVPTIAITALLAVLTASIWGEKSIAGFGYEDGLLSPVVAACNIVFMQDVFCRQYGNNMSLWSLTHEFWYYVCFPMLFSPFLRPRLLGSFLVATLALSWLVLLSVLQFHPVSIGLYFVIWLLGVGVAVANPVRVFSRFPVLAAFAIMMCVISSFRTIDVLFEDLMPAQFIADMVVAFSFCFVLSVLKAKKDLFSPPVRQIHQHLAKFSFSLYCFHVPVVVAFGAFGVNVMGVSTGPDVVDAARWVYVFSGIALCIGSSYVLYLLTEQHTDLVRRFVFRFTAGGGSGVSASGGPP